MIRTKAHPQNLAHGHILQSYPLCAYVYLICFVFGSFLMQSAGGLLHPPTQQDDGLEVPPAVPNRAGRRGNAGESREGEFSGLSTMQWQRTVAPAQRSSQTYMCLTHAREYSSVRCCLFPPTFACVLKRRFASRHLPPPFFFVFCIYFFEPLCLRSRASHQSIVAWGSTSPFPSRPRRPRLPARPHAHGKKKKRIRTRITLHPPRGRQFCPVDLIPPVAPVPPTCM